MKRKHCNIKKAKYKHLSEGDRYKLEAFLEGKNSVNEICRILRRDKSTIYREIKRGTISRIQTDLTEKNVYRANVAQNDYLEKGKNKERSLKIGKDKKLEQYIREKILTKNYSPDAIIGQINDKRMKFESKICTKTLYNYIDAGIFSGISNKDLLEKWKKKPKKKKKVSRVSSKNRMSRSIEERPEKINNREEYGHWEGDTVKGAQGMKTGLFTLTERKTREEIIFKIPDSTQKSILTSMDDLERSLGDGFKDKFKSITFDNGPEFLDWKGIEKSIFVSDESRVITYFAHPYSSWERGTNENHNRMIRRFIPKGTDISIIDEEEIRRIQDWMNDYPRKILGYKTPTEMAEKCLQK